MFRLQSYQLSLYFLSVYLAPFAIFPIAVFSLVPVEINFNFASIKVFKKGKKNILIFFP
nr:MAG TPA: hypothetical protein [Herelleviridae sp.]